MSNMGQRNHFNICTKISILEVLKTEFHCFGVCTYLRYLQCPAWVKKKPPQFKHLYWNRHLGSAQYWISVFWHLFLVRPRFQKRKPQHDQGWLLCDCHWANRLLRRELRQAAILFFYWPLEPWTPLSSRQLEDAIWSNSVLMKMETFTRTRVPENTEDLLRGCRACLQGFYLVLYLVSALPAVAHSTSFSQICSQVFNGGMCFR